MYHDCRLSRCWKSPASLRQRYFPNPHLQLLAAVAETAQVTLLWRHQVTSRLHQLLVLELIVSFSCDLSVQCTCTDYWLWTIRRASVDSMYLRQSCFDGWLNKKLSCRTETARRVVSLNISLSRSRSCEVTLLRRSCMSPYKYFNDATSVYRTVSEIFSVKEWRDLETGVRVVQGYWKWRRSIDHTTFYWSAIVIIAVCCTIFKLFGVE